MAKKSAVRLTEAVEHSSAAPPDELQAKRIKRPQGHTTRSRRQKASGARRVSRAVRVGAMVAAAVASMTYALRCVMPRLASTENLRGWINVGGGMSRIRRLAAGEGDGPRMRRSGWRWAGGTTSAERVKCDSSSVEGIASLETPSYFSLPGPGGRPETQRGLGGDALTFFGQEFRLFGGPEGTEPWHFSGDHLPALEIDEVSPPAFLLESTSGSSTEAGSRAQASAFYEEYKGDSIAGRPGGLPGGEEESRLSGPQGTRHLSHLYGVQLPALDTVGNQPSASVLDHSSSRGVGAAPRVPAGGLHPTSGGRPSGGSLEAFPRYYPGPSTQGGAQTGGAQLAAGQAALTPPSAAEEVRPDPPPPVFGYFVFSPTDQPVPLFVPRSVFTRSMLASRQFGRSFIPPEVARVQQQLAESSRKTSPHLSSGSHSTVQFTAAPSLPSPSPSSEVASRDSRDQPTFRTPEDNPSTAGAGPAQRPTSAAKASIPRLAASQKIFPAQPAATGTARSGWLSNRVRAVQRRRQASPTFSSGLQPLRSPHTSAAGPDVGELREGAGGREPSEPRAAPAQFTKEVEQPDARSVSVFRQGRGNDEATRATVSGTDPGFFGGGGQSPGPSQKRQLRKEANGLRGADVRGQSSGQEGRDSTVSRGKGDVDGTGRGATGGDSTGAWSGKGRQASTSGGEGRGKA
ncbi:hypothetical protein CSUI_010216, partial [Cystoisospora suis]